MDHNAPVLRSRSIAICGGRCMKFLPALQTSMSMMTKLSRLVAVEVPTREQTICNVGRRCCQGECQVEKGKENSAGNNFRCCQYHVFSLSWRKSNRDVSHSDGVDKFSCVATSAGPLRQRLQKDWGNRERVSRCVDDVLHGRRSLSTPQDAQSISIAVHALLGQSCAMGHLVMSSAITPYSRPRLMYAFLP